MSLRDVRELIGELLHAATARPATEPPAPRVVLPTLDERRRQRAPLDGPPYTGPIVFGTPWHEGGGDRG
jgi:hypothetical protein